MHRSEHHPHTIPYHTKPCHAIEVIPIITSTNTNDPKPTTEQAATNTNHIPS